MANRLDGKVAVITGAASGIGRAGACAFSEEGARVVVADIDDAGGAETVSLIEQAGGTACFASLDVTDEARWDTVMAEAAERYGAVSVVVNNAGIALPGALMDFSYDRWKQQMAVNADSVFLGTRAAMRAMSQTGGGSIINVSSIAGLRGYGGATAYCASKGAVRQFTKAAAVECARMRLNIRVNAIFPGVIETPIWEKSQQQLAEAAAKEGSTAKMPKGANSVETEERGKSVPIGRVGQPEEIARTMVFLASDESSYTTGAEFVVDGGETV